MFLHVSNKEFFEINYPRGGAIEVFRWFVLMLNSGNKTFNMK